MTLEEKLIDYFSRRGVILTKEKAKFLINMIVTEYKDNLAVITRYRYNGVSKGYEIIRTMKVPMDIVNAYYSKNAREVKQFWKYVVRDADNQAMPDIYSLNPSLFD